MERLTNTDSGCDRDTASGDASQRYRVLFMTMSHGVVYQDAQGRITEANPAAEAILGVTIDEMRGRASADPRWQAVYEDGAVCPGENHPSMQALRTGRAVPNRVLGIFNPVRRERRWLSVGAVPLFAAGEDRPFQVYTTFVDITDRLLTEEDLRQTHARLVRHSRFTEALLSAIPTPVFFKDTEGRYIGCNRAFTEVLGLTGEQIRGKTVHELWPSPNADVYHRKDLELLRNPALQVYEHELVDKDGRTRSVLYVKDVFRDEHGTPAGIVGAFVDLTQHKQAESAARGYFESFKSVVTAAPWGLHFYRLDGDGRLLFTGANPAADRILGVEHAALVGKTIEEAFPGLCGTSIPKTYADIAKSGGVFHDEQVRYSHGKVQGAFDVRAFQTSTDCMAASFLDITARKQAEVERLDMERRLLHAQKLESLGVLAGGIAHDFNNLLMAILGNLDLALLDIPESLPARVSVEQAVHASHRAADLTRQMLAYSGRGRFVISRVDLSELVQENAHLFKAVVAKNVAFQMNLDRRVPPIEADPGQIQQVVMNLITNASESVGEAQGTLVLSTGARDCDAAYLSGSRTGEPAAPGWYVYLDVADSGCGMDADTLQRVFDPFFTTKLTGRGLGMSAVLGIVRGHRGAILVDSRPGRGTTVRVLFPMSAPAPAAAVDTAGPLPAQPHSAALGPVLIVDDEEQVLDTCRAMVRRLGFSVLTAADGEKALALFREHTDLAGAIVDLTMPRMDGVAVCREMLRLRPGVKVILSSGYDEQDAMRRFSGAHLAAFIHKPYALDDLRRVLNRVFGAAEPSNAGGTTGPAA